MRRKGGSTLLPQSSLDVGGGKERGKHKGDRRLWGLVGLLAVLLVFLVAATVRESWSGRGVEEDDDDGRGGALDDDDDDEDDDFGRSRWEEKRRRESSERERMQRREVHRKAARAARENAAAAKEAAAAATAAAEEAAAVVAARRGEETRAATEKKAHEKRQVETLKDAQKRRIEEVTARVHAERARKAAGPAVSVLDEHHHVLAYYLRAARAGAAEAATIVHIDSHADLGVPRAYLGETPLGPGLSRTLEEYAEINDFLVLAAFAGLADHVVFVEPPWSNQFRCCVYETNATFDFVVGLDSRDALRVDVDGETATKFARDRFGHVFWRNGERRTGDKTALRRTRAFRVTLVALEHATLAATLAAVVDPARPLVVDVDLDAFATVSPGAIATKSRFGLTDPDLEILYHLVWNFPDLGPAYLAEADPRRRDRLDARDYVERANQRVARANADDRGTSRLAAALARVLDARDVDPGRKGAILDFAALVDKSPRSAAAQRPRPLDSRGQANLEAYLEQPYHKPDNFPAELDFVLANIWTPVFAALPTPAMVHLVRSPGYLPEDLLPTVECRFLDFLKSVYAVDHVTHEDRVDATKTSCAHDSYLRLEKL